MMSLFTSWCTIIEPTIISSNNNILSVRTLKIKRVSNIDSGKAKRCKPLINKQTYEVGRLFPAMSKISESVFGR